MNPNRFKPIIIDNIRAIYHVDYKSATKAHHGNFTGSHLFKNKGCQWKHYYKVISNKHGGDS